MVQYECVVRGGENIGIASKTVMIEQKIISGDALKVMPLLPSESFDLIIADPPYNIGKDYGNNYDEKGFDEYLHFSRSWLNEAYRLLKPTGTIYVFMGFRFISYLYDILHRELGMLFNSWIVWHYTQGMGKTRGFSPRHDDILMFTKSRKFITHKGSHECQTTPTTSPSASDRAAHRAARQHTLLPGYPTCLLKSLAMKQRLSASGRAKPIALAFAAMAPLSLYAPTPRGIVG